MGDVVELYPQPKKKEPIKWTPRAERLKHLGKAGVALTLAAVGAAGALMAAGKSIEGKPADIKIVPQQGQPYRLVHAGQEYTNPRTHETSNLITLTQIVEAGYGNRIATQDGIDQLRTQEGIDPNLQPGEEIRLSPDAAIGELVDPNTRQ